MEQEYGVGRALAALEGAGLLSSAPDGKGRRYEVTEAGRKFYTEREGQSVGLTVQKVKHGFMCFADMRVDKVIPDADRLAALRAERSRLAQERVSLHVHDHAAVVRIRAEYGAVIRAHRAS